MSKPTQTPGTTPDPAGTRVRYARAALLRGDDDGAADHLICLLAEIVQGTLEAKAGDTSAREPEITQSDVLSYIAAERRYHADLRRWGAVRGALGHADEGLASLMGAAEDIATDGEQATLRAALQTITALYDRTNADD